MFRSIWNKIKAWSGWDEAGSIVNARVTVIGGFVLAVAGSMDWSPLLSLGIDTGVNWKQIVILGGIMVAKGVLDEVIRRRKATDL